MGNRSRLLLTIGIAAMCFPMSAQALPLCSTPSPAANAFSQGASKTLTWTVGSPNGGGFVIEVATEATFDGDGSFKDSKLVQTATVSSSARERTFSGLLERRYFYHLRANARSGVCDASQWSATVSTVQDATLPSAEFTMPSNSPVEGVEIPPVHGGSTSLRGRVTDPVGPGAPVSSGAKSAVVRLTNTTPVLGGTGEPIPPRSVATDVDGSFIASYTGLAPGLYAATVTGVDGVGNESAAPDSYAFVVAG